MSNTKHLVNGEKLTVSEACKKYGISYTTIKYRLEKQGLSLEEAIQKGRTGKRKIKIGEVFGHLTCLGQSSKYGGKNKSNAYYLVKCDCGKEIEVLGMSLKRGTKTSCNSENCEFSKWRNHGYRNSIEYTVWSSMCQRCSNPNNPNYNCYGGRGIKVCEEWQKDFLIFLKDVGERPSIEHSLDRIDVNGNYEPDNVRWVLKKEQASNRRTFKMYEDRIKYLEGLLIKNNITF